jgi:sugar phosphate isomerase/epimerase
LMESSQFVISGFGDEIAAEPAEQLAVLRELGIQHLDLRGAWGRNVLDLSDDDVRRLRGSLSASGARVAMIASPVGKSEISRDAAYERGRLEIALRLAAEFETSLVRIFSFYLDGRERADCRAEVVRRLAEWASRAEAANVTLLLENERDLWGDTPDRCLDLLRAVDSLHLRLTLDTGNFATLGVRSADEAYPMLRPYLAHIQIKDVRHAEGQTVPAGEGDGQIPELLAALRRDGYRGLLSLEPHLAEAGKAGGFSGPALFAQAAHALQRLLQEPRPPCPP